MRRFWSGIAGFAAGITIACSAVVFAAQMEVVENAYPITLNGVEVSISGYNIEGNTYFKLRDIGEAIGFEVDFVDNTIVLTSDTRQGGHTEEIGKMMTVEEFTAQLTERVAAGEITQEEADAAIAEFSQREERTPKEEMGEAPSEPAAAAE
ncbi:MAG: hypothetical protein Q4C12_02850 [Clostridia bacterium]|nr:hypothetical protein [Clostridia bacterium]